MEHIDDLAKSSTHIKKVVQKWTTLVKIKNLLLSSQEKHRRWSIKSCNFAEKHDEGLVTKHDFH